MLMADGLGDSNLGLQDPMTHLTKEHFHSVSGRVRFPVQAMARTRDSESSNEKALLIRHERRQLEDFVF